MKSFVIPIVTFLLGLLLGAGAFYFISPDQSHEVISTMAVGETSALATYGTLLSEKRYEDLQRLLESSMLTSLKFQKGLALSDKDDLASQKFVRGYFDATGKSAPPPIEEQIVKVPVGKGVEMQPMADFAVTHLAQ